MRRSLALALALLGGGGGCIGYTPVRRQCPRCVVFDRHLPPAEVPAGTEALYVLVPGILGFGWEWDAPVLALERTPRVATQVFEWRPTSSLERVTAELVDGVNRLLRSAPPSLRHLVVVGHSAGGIVTAHAAARIDVPAGLSVRVVNVGAPYAGLHTMPFEFPPDNPRAPFVFAVGGDLTRYPRPAPGVAIESHVTSPDTDPVMRHRFGHAPDHPAIGPPGPRHRLPRDADHNEHLGAIVRDSLRRLGFEPATSLPSLAGAPPSPRAPAPPPPRAAPPDDAVRAP